MSKPFKMDSSYKLELLKNKEEHAQSANASQEVKEYLANFLSQRQGSSTQINTIPYQAGTHNSASNNNNNNSSASFAGGRGSTMTMIGQNDNFSINNNNGCNLINKVGISHMEALINQNQTDCYMAINNSNIVVQNDDHPLRKTASMPTMHIPYKAPSISRRRQMDRRTTMSPLMKRQSRPRRQLLRSQNSNSTEYSSNPCITTMKHRDRPSSSQSSSPPPTSINLQARDGAFAGNDNHHQPASASGASSHHHTQNSKPEPNSSAMAPTSSQPIKLASIYTSKELNDLKNSYYHQGGSGQKANNQAPNGHQVAGLNAQQQQQLKQHQQVNEALRKSIISRSPSKGKLVVGGSLDMESSGPAGSYKQGDFSGPANASFGARDELRQKSLDGCDLVIAGAATNKMASSLSSQVLAPKFNMYHKIRLATTSDAAYLRHSQSPSTSISMGLMPGGGLGAGSGPGSGSGAPQQLLANRAHQQHPCHWKHYSSSSSSTSSLLSQQDSLEDSSSQAIDLSSSKDSARNRSLGAHHSLHQKPVNHGFSSTPLAGQQQPVSKHLASQLMKGAPKAAGSQQQQPNQKLLLDSFNQLQLCKSSEDQLKNLILSSGSSSVKQQHHFARQHHHQHSSLAAGLKATAIFDAPYSQQGSLMNTLAQQFNLSASAQNLVALQEQQASNQLAPGGSSKPATPLASNNQTADFNQRLLSTYNDMIQSNDIQQTNQITSAFLNTLISLPEPYKSNLLAHLLQQQQQRATHAGNGASQEDSTRALISRALSSPLLIASSTLLPMQHQQDQVMGPDQGLVGNEQQQQIELLRYGNQCGPARMVVDSTGTGANRMPGSSCKGSQYSGPVGEQGPGSLDLSTKLADERLPVAANMNKLDRINLASGGDSLIRFPLGPDQAAGVGASNKQVSAQSSSSSSSLNFNYTPVDPKRASCSFIYNPIFDKHSRTGIIYELEMCNHKCICGNECNHPENSFRVLAIWRRLHDKGLMAKCARIEARRATLEEIQLCHSETYSCYFGKSPYERIKLSHLDLSKLPIEGLTQLECGGQGADIDTAWNEEQTPGVARLAAGCVIEAAVEVAKGKIANAFAIVRPPGHHAEHQHAMGFCFFNSIAIATKVLLEKHQDAKILIVDWDVHHGNGLQKVFYEDKSVMYISLHRHDNGNFFPGTGGLREIGSGPGEGFNWNVAWSGDLMGDAEYLAAFRTIVMPIAGDFNPSMVLVACGFDAAQGHPSNFGGYELSAACFAHMTRQLMSLADGRLVLCLEGGYHLEAICDCSEACMRALLNETQTDSSSVNCVVRDSELRREPNQSAICVLRELSNLAVRYWPSVGKWQNQIELSAHEATNLKIR